MPVKTISASRVNSLSFNHRQLLIDHIDGEIPIHRHGAQHTLHGRLTLIRAGLLRAIPDGSIRPQSTVLTALGRQALCMVLAQYAEALVRAGLIEQEIQTGTFERLSSLALA